MKKIGSEFLIGNDNFRMIAGTTDKKNPSAHIYFAGSIYVTPESERKEYAEDFKHIKDEAKHLVNKLVGKDINKGYIFVLNIADSRLKKEKKSYLTFELHCKPITEEKTFKTIAKQLYSKIAPICAEIYDITEKQGFVLSKTNN